MVDLKIIKMESLAVKNALQSHILIYFALTNPVDVMMVWYRLVHGTVPFLV